MSVRGAENFRPNPDGTYGPNHWSIQELSDWAHEDMRKSSLLYPLFWLFEKYLTIKRCFDRK